MNIVKGSLLKKLAFLADMSAKGRNRGGGAVKKNNNICIHDKKKLKYFLIMSVEAISDMSAKKVSFFWTAPPRATFLSELFPTVIQCNIHSSREY